MAIDLNVNESAKGKAAARAAEALLRTMGNAEVIVRVWAPIAAEGDGAQLGLAPVATEDVQLAPVVLRPAKDGKGNFQRKQREALVAASTVFEARALKDPEMVTSFFEASIGVLVGKVMMRVESVLVEDFAGSPYLYRVILSE
jgi:hypothetical protein